MVLLTSWLGTEEATLVANVRQHAMMRAIQDEEYQELHIIEYMNERQWKELISAMNRKQKRGTSTKLCQEIKVLDDRVSKVERWRDTVAAECGVIQEAAAGFQISKAEVDRRGGSSSERHRGGSASKSRRLRRKGERLMCHHHSLMSHLDQNMEGEDDENLEELGFVPVALSGPRWAPHMCDKEVQSEGFQVLQNCGYCDGRKVRRNERRAKHGKTEEGGGRTEVVPR